MRILIAEDNLIHREVLKSYLKNWGHEVIVADDGLEAFELFESFQEMPEMLVTDWLMPKMNGLELARRIRSITANAPYIYILLLTAKSDTKDLITGFREGGVDDYVVKPFDITELEMRIQVGERIIHLERAHREYNRDLKRQSLESLRAEVAQRRLTEEELRASNERFQSLSENAPDIIYTLGTDGTFNYVNPAWENILGHRREEVIGKTFIDFANEEDIKTYTDFLKQVREGQGIMSDIIMTLLHKHGTTRVFNISGAPNLNSKGHITGIVGLLKDITEQQQLQRQLQQSQKMEAIGTLAGGIAHDFNNILGAIRGYSELASLNLHDTEKVKIHIGHVLKAGLRASELVKQILAFSRHIKPERKLLDIAPIVKEVLNLLRAPLPSTIEIQRFIGESGVILADPTQIHQVLMNLCTNAAHAMRDTGGILEVNLLKIEVNEKKMGDAADLKSGHYLQLTVSDTGQGMDTQTLSQIFDPFFTTKAPGEGTGMGLSVVHGIIKDHNGAISVHSNLGQGTTFRVYLPLVDEVVEIEDDAAKKILRGTENILLVDDENVLVNLSIEMLTYLGYNATGFSSGAKALETFRNTPGAYDLVITDHTMPNMNGIQLAQELHRIRPDLPIILSTGFSKQMMAKKDGASHISAYVMKPFEMYELATLIREILDKL
ncbi:response regulator [Desulfococcaceae bacterium HSG7]|nr:response regulator [Desulfococcaceae bacterium HSG7]